jgi:effector-binding domain-containing protein
MDMGYEFETEQVEPQPIAAIRATTTPSELGRQFEKWLPAVRRFLEERGLRVAGPSIARYHDYREDFVDVEAGYVIEAPGKPEKEDAISTGELPGGTVAVTWHVGPYDTISGAFDALHDWIHRQGKEEGAGPWEIYWTGPGDESDSSKWRTEIRWPVG